MAFTAAYAPPLRASIVPSVLKRTMTATPEYAAAAWDRPVTPSMPALLGVASNCAVKEPVWAVNAVFCHAPELTRHPGGSGGVTVIAALPLCPSLVAVIVAVPATCPVTSPLPFTVATLVLSLAHVTVRPDSGLPAASLGVAVSCAVCPTASVADGGVTATDATGSGALGATVMVAV